MLAMKDKLKFFLNFAPINFTWLLAKKTYKLFHKGITASRALIYFIIWNFTEKKHLYQEIDNCFVKDIKPYTFLRWKHKICYFTGLADSKKVFIKSGGIMNNIKRETVAMCYAHKNSAILHTHLPELIATGDTIIVQEMIKGKSLTSFDNAPDAIQASLIQQLFEIYSELKRTGILHLDIRPQNFIVSDGNKLFIIDFGYALVNTDNLFDMLERNAQTKTVLKNLGSDYAPKNGTLDDAYSMLLTMKYVCPGLIHEYPKIWKQLNEDIGTRIITL